MRAPRRSPAFNTLVIGGIITIFALAGVVIWNWWTAEAVSAADAGPPDPTLLWALVVIGGPLVLLVALIIARVRSGRAAKQDDPRTPSDDPARGQ